MKEFMKNILNWLNYNSVLIFARYHFRKQAVLWNNAHLELQVAKSKGRLLNWEGC